MGYIVIIVLAGLIGATITYSYSQDIVEGILGFFAGILIGMLITLFTFVVISANATEVPVQSSSQPLYALQDGSSTSGAFFLGNGIVSGDMRYTYLIQTVNGMSMETADVSHAYIKEDDKGKPRVIINTTKFKSDFLNNWFPDMLPTETYTFIIPKGSIKYQYNVDLKN